MATACPTRKATTRRRRTSSSSTGTSRGGARNPVDLVGAASAASFSGTGSENPAPRHDRPDQPVIPHCPHSLIPPARRRSSRLKPLHESSGFRQGLLQLVEALPRILAQARGAALRGGEIKRRRLAHAAQVVPAQ